MEDVKDRPAIINDSPEPCTACHAAPGRPHLGICDAVATEYRPVSPDAPDADEVRL